LLLCSCGPDISDRRVEKVTFPGGEVLINESHIAADGSICFHDCGSSRSSKLTLQAPGQEPEEIGAVGPSRDLSCCLVESVKPVRMERSGELQAIAFGIDLFTKWDSESIVKRLWSHWTLDQDIETGHFLRHFPCKITAPSQIAPGPCAFPGGQNPYRNPTLDLSAPIARFSRRAPESGWPAVLVYSSPTRAGWQFDFDRTIHENPNLEYRAFPSEVLVEVRFLQAKGKSSATGSNTPEDFSRQYPNARVVLQRTLPISTTAWTTVSVPMGSGRYSYDFRAAYGDPDPDWATIYTRWTGWKGQEARFLGIGGWFGFGAAGGVSESDTVVAGFIRMIRR
jgi:hypothetical protein